MYICIIKKKKIIIYNIILKFFFYRFNLTIDILLQESNHSNFLHVNFETNFAQVQIVLIVIKFSSCYLHIYKISKDWDDKWSEDTRIEPAKRAIGW